MKNHEMTVSPLVNPVLPLAKMVLALSILAIVIFFVVAQLLSGTEEEQGFADTSLVSPQFQWEHRP